MLPFIDVQAQHRALGERIDRAVARVLEHGRFILGPEVEELERRLAAYCGVDDVVTCANGTDALELALMVHDLRPGQGVVVPTFTFAATAEAVALRGGVPIFADVDRRTFDMRPDHARAAIEAARQVGVEPVGIIGVDLYGIPADYAGLDEMATHEGLWLIADAAQSFGASRGGEKVGRHASLTTASFYPAKPLSANGDAGAVILRDGEVGELLRSLRVHGSEPHDKYENVRIGRNSRLDTLQAAVLLVKLEVFDEELAARQRVAAAYTAELDGLVEAPLVPDDAISSWAQYTVLLPEGADRDAVRGRMAERGVPTAVHYQRPLHRQRAYAGHPVAADVSGAEHVAARVLSLPMHAYLDDESRDRVVGSLRAALDQTTAAARISR